MRSSGRPVFSPSSTGRSECIVEARLRRHDAQLDGPRALPGLRGSTPDLQGSAPRAAGLTLTRLRNKGRCVMMLDPTPPYHVRDFCPDCREKLLAVVGWMAPALESALSPAPPEPIITPEDTLRGAGISNERLALYQRRMSSRLAGRG